MKVLSTEKKSTIYKLCKLQIYDAIDISSFLEKKKIQIPKKEDDNFIIRILYQPIILRFGQVRSLYKSLLPVYCSMQQKWGETFTSNYGINCGKITHFKFPPALLFCPARL